LDLQAQGVFRALAQRPVEAHTLHASPPALIHQQHLLCVCAGQSIRRVPRQAVHGARRDDIAQALQGGPHSGRPTLAFVQTLHRLGPHEARGRDALAHRRYLAGASLSFGWRVG
jgi:hypothetical protein